MCNKAFNATVAWWLCGIICMIFNAILLFYLHTIEVLKSKNVKAAHIKKSD